jgi:hypothetical protein
MGAGFCFVVESRKAELVGFAKGKAYTARSVARAGPTRRSIEAIWQIRSMRPKQVGGIGVRAEVLRTEAGK